MTLATEYTKACGLVGAHQLVSSYICCVIGNVMRDTRAFPFVGTIRCIRGTIHATQSLSRENGLVAIPASAGTKFMKLSKVLIAPLVVLVYLLLSSISLEAEK